MVCKVTKTSSPAIKLATSGHVTKSSSPKKSMTKREFTSLKKVVPSVAESPEATKLDVILAAIEYIQSLEDQLLLSAEPQALKAKFLAKMMEAC